MWFHICLVVERLDQQGSFERAFAPAAGIVFG
jgi:hypothetical protein